jgi:hypothetical protein
LIGIISHVCGAIDSCAYLLLQALFKRLDPNEAALQNIEHELHVDAPLFAVHEAPAPYFLGAFAALLVRFIRKSRCPRRAAAQAASLDSKP